MPQRFAVLSIVAYIGLYTFSVSLSVLLSYLTNKRVHNIIWHSKTLAQELRKNFILLQMDEHFSVDFSLRLDSLLFWAPWHQSMSIVHLFPAVFYSSTWNRGGVWMCKLDLDVNH